VPIENQHLAYEDTALPIGFDQTISQPYMVALMTVALEVSRDQKVLELGTGSGYQTAILAELARFVVTTERVSALAKRAATLLYGLGYTNIEVHIAGETLGWSRGAPYEAIMVTAGSPCVPDDLIAQLAIGGRLVIPVGSRYEQELCKVTKQRRKNIIENLCGCRFVPLVGKGAWKE
jgi:protein-L-isoaspartate(D-aspartate) O-methyltransferase